jgi:hypothetical protein
MQHMRDFNFCPKPPEFQPFICPNCLLALIIAGWIARCKEWGFGQRMNGRVTRYGAVPVADVMPGNRLISAAISLDGASATACAGVLSAFFG